MGDLCVSRSHICTHNISGMIAYLDQSHTHTRVSTERQDHSDISPNAEESNLPSHQGFSTHPQALLPRSHGSLRRNTFFLPFSADTPTPHHRTPCAQGQFCPTFYPADRHKELQAMFSVQGVCVYCVSVYKNWSVL